MNNLPDNFLSDFEDNEVWNYACDMFGTDDPSQEQMGLAEDELSNLAQRQQAGRYA